MRKILTFLFAALMSASMFALDPRSGDTWDEGTKTLTVNSDLPEDAYKYQDVIQHVIINNGVTSIGVDAFKLCTGLTSVTIPEGVTSIGYGAFYNCFGLTSVTCVRATPANLGNDVFYQTHANLKIYVPAGSVDAYKTAENWSAYAAKIKAIPPAWVRDGDDWDDATKTLTVNSNPGNYAYINRTVIKHVIINNGVTSIGFSAFIWCEGLTSVTIPNSVTSIGTGAFAACYALTSVTIPSSVEYIGEAAFFRCKCLTSVTCVRETPANLGHYGVFRETHANLKIYVPAGSVNAYKGAKYWSAYAAKIKAISPAPEWVRDGDLWDTDTKTLTVKSNLPEDAYKDQTVIQHVIINNDVTSIGNYAFYSCTNLSSVTFGNSVTSIEWGAFAGCSGLTSVTIPNSVTSIGEGAFSGCTALTSIVVESGNSKYDSRDNCNAIIEKSSNTLIAGCKNTIIPNSVTSIGDYTFFYCTALTSITIPNSVTSIGDYTFAVCTGLTSITIPDSVKSIGAGAFAACIGLTSIEIPNSVEYIGAEAFAGCSGLTSITIPNSVDSIGDYTFAVCTGLTSITIPNSVTSIGDSAFLYCSGLTSVTCVRETPASLGNDAFNECSNLNAIYVPCGTLDAYQSSWTQYPSYIKYAQPKYTIIGNVNIAGAGTVILPQTICDSSITASPNYGYHFVQWSDGVTENPRTIELTQDTTFTAVFAKNTYSITKQTIAEQGSISGNSQAEYLDSVILDAIPNYGYHFTQWSDGVTDNPRSFVLTQDTTFTAEFAKNTYSITKLTISEQGTITGKSQAEYLDSVILDAIPNYGYHFTQWSDGVTENPRAFVLTQDTTFTAEFALDRTGKCGNDWALTWTYDPEGKVLTISGNGAFEQNMQCGVEARGEMTEVIFEDGVTSIGNFAFQDCIGLTSVTIGNSVISIGGSAFHSCSGLKSVSIGNSVTSIGHAAFSSCEGLTSVTIGNSVTSIGDNAFQYCYGLTSITIPNSVTSIGESAFAMCSSLSSVTIPSSVTSIGADAFIGCTNITDVYCYPNAANLTWNESGCDDFKASKATRCHVYAGQLSAYQSKFTGTVNVTFVGDLTLNITPNVDPQNDGVYYSTFFDSANKYALPDGVEAYVATLSGSDLLLTKIAEAGQVIPNNNAVILKSSVTPFTLTPSEAEAVTFSATNDLQGTDGPITTPANCYVLGGADGVVGFYRYNAATLNSHKAFVIYTPTPGQGNAPKRMPFVFNQATGVENVQGAPSGQYKGTKVLRDGQLIIIRNGVEYNANGMMVK